MFRIETGVDKERSQLLRSRLLAANTAASPVLRSLRGTPGEREVPLQIWALDPDSHPDSHPDPAPDSHPPQGSHSADGLGGGLVGGLIGHTWATWLHVTYLWVAEPHRRSGLGSHLLSQAEHLAHTSHGCRNSRLETWDFQAPDFYRKRGYEVVCVIPDYPPGVTEYTLTKRLG